MSNDITNYRWWKTEMPAHENCDCKMDPIHDPTNGFRFPCNPHELYITEDGMIMTKKVIEMELARIKGLIDLESIKNDHTLSYKDAETLLQIYGSYEKAEDFLKRAKKYYLGETMRSVEITKIEWVRDYNEKDFTTGDYIVYSIHHCNKVELARFRGTSMTLSKNLMSLEEAEMRAKEFERTLYESNEKMEHKQVVEHVEACDVGKPEELTITELKEKFRKKSYISGTGDVISEMRYPHQALKDIEQWENEKLLPHYRLKFNPLAVRSWDAKAYEVFKVDYKEMTKETVALFTYEPGKEESKERACQRATKYAEKLNKRENCE